MQNNVIHTAQIKEILTKVWYINILFTNYLNHIENIAHIQEEDKTTIYTKLLLFNQIINYKIQVYISKNALNKEIPSSYISHSLFTNFLKKINKKNKIESLYIKNFVENTIIHLNFILNELFFQKAEQYEYEEEEDIITNHDDKLLDEITELADFADLLAEFVLHNNIL